MRGLKDRQTTRKRPFAGWMRRLANLKPSSSDNQNGTGKKSNGAAKKASAKNNPYPESGHINPDAPGRLSYSTPDTPQSHESFTSAEEAAAAQQRQHAKSTRSNAPTVATMPETVHSQRSKAETGNTNQNGGSTFSSPNGSEHSLTTTLTTIQSSAPSHILGAGQTTQPAATTSAPPVHFSHQFPTSPPPSAIPPHLAPQQGPHSYHAATANNVLTDDASILTLASSSKRRRRNSLDTNASVRAMAPSSHYGGSRESLPLSVLSGNVDTIYSASNRPSNVNGLSNANAERASVYSVSGATAPVLSSERNSYYANKQADGLSVRSGLLGHGRTDSISSIRAMHTASPLTSPRDPPLATKLSRRSSEWIPDAGEASDEDEEETPAASMLKEEEEEEKEVGRPLR
ncbi:hypothetical protein BU25DRAFT_412769 [Macroventuria anomochaeta]|uniref:Uncharacterized protein n=1 Tax=Macroventuria anomochaeta TaxID=301207 RepID=A0ACB6RW23_9PLEO|nr:uncharacterized protein BU25DRAFT_412769 [Macroventuria anomochaeta]KAF2625334.1 hypothetical protein BU25DRAFT_412769 [Macroventuria anomochaeta]